MAGGGSVGDGRSRSNKMSNRPYHYEFVFVFLSSFQSIVEVVVGRFQKPLPWLFSRTLNKRKRKKNKKDNTIHISEILDTLAC